MTPSAEQRQRIINAAVRHAISTGKEDFQEAQNEAYSQSLAAGFPEDEASEIALEAGTDCPF